MGLWCAAVVARVLAGAGHTMPQAWACLAALAGSGTGTAAHAAAIAAAALVLAMPIGWSLQRLPRRWAALAQAMLWFPTVTLALAWLLAAAVPAHAAAAAADSARAAISFLPGTNLRLLTLLVPPCAVIWARALRRVADPAAMRAAATLGASPLRSLWRIVLPGMAASLTIGGLLAFVAAWVVLSVPRVEPSDATDGRAWSVLAAAVVMAASALWPIVARLRAGAGRRDPRR
jgi:ABC-type sulfate transport system permease component